MLEPSGELTQVENSFGGNPVGFPTIAFSKNPECLTKPKARPQIGSVVVFFCWGR